MGSWICERGGVMNLPKLRAWDKWSEKMIEEVTLIDYNNQEIAFGDGVLFMKDFDCVEFMWATGLYTVPLCPELDYERKEIFEGDILKWYYSEGIELQQQGTFVVVFENGAFRPGSDSDITLHEMLEDCDWAKVIGNIYENPELLEEEK